jgi:hypothetical protein
LYVSPVADNDWLYFRGCAQGYAQSGHSKVILAFGQPQLVDEAYPPDWGTFAWGEDATREQIKLAVVEYAQGFWDCSYGTSKVTTLVVGTSNEVAATGTVNADHGAAWGAMVNELNLFLVNSGMASRISLIHRRYRPGAQLVVLLASGGLGRWLRG